MHYLSFTRLFSFLVLPAASSFFALSWAQYIPAAIAAAGALFGGDDGPSEAELAQARAAETNANISKDQWDRYKTAFIPVEDSLIAESMQAPDIQGARDRASADVVQAFSKARGITTRNLARMGAGVLSGATGAALGRQDIEQAKVDAHSRYQAGEMEKDKSWDKRTQVVGLGKGLPGAAQAGLSSAGRMYGDVARMGYARDAANASARGSAARYIAGLPWDKMGGEDDFKVDASMADTFADGGEVNGPGTGTSDSIPARLSDGEYVVPADVVRAKGTEFFDKLLDKHHKPVKRGLPMRAA